MDTPERALERGQEIAQQSTDALHENLDASYQLRANARGLEGDKGPTIEDISGVIATALESAYGGAWTVTGERLDR